MSVCTCNFRDDERTTGQTRGQSKTTKPWWCIILFKVAGLLLYCRAQGLRQVQMNPLTTRVKPTPILFAVQVELRGRCRGVLVDAWRWPPLIPAVTCTSKHCRSRKPCSVVRFTLFSTSHLHINDIEYSLMTVTYPAATLYNTSGWNVVSLYDRVVPRLCSSSPEL